MESLFKHKCYEIGYVELSEKSDSFQEITAPKNSSSSEKVAVRKKYLLRKSTYSE